MINCLCQCHVPGYGKLPTLHNCCGMENIMMEISNYDLLKRIEKLEQDNKDLNESYQGLSAELRHVINKINLPKKCDHAFEEIVVGSLADYGKQVCIKCGWMPHLSQDPNIKLEQKESEK